MQPLKIMREQKKLQSLFVGRYETVLSIFPQVRVGGNTSLTVIMQSANKTVSSGEMQNSTFPSAPSENTLW